MSGLPVWVAPFLSLAEFFKPALTPFIQFCVDTFNQVSGGQQSFQNAFTLDPVPASIHGTSGYFVKQWTPGVLPPQPPIDLPNLPMWIRGIIVAAEQVDPPLTPYLNDGLAIYQHAEATGTDFKSNITFPPIPCSIAGVQGYWTDAWYIGPIPGSASQLAA